MANWKLNFNTKRLFHQELDRLLNIRAITAERDFPLNVQQVVQATMPAKALECFNILRGMGCTTQPVTEGIYAYVPEGLPENPGTNVMGVERACLLRLTVNPTQYFVWEEQRYGGEDVWKRRNDPDRLRRITFDLSQLDHTARLKFTKWLNVALVERRLCNAAKCVTQQFINDHCDSLAEMQQRWPGLRVVFAKMPDPWPTRMRDISRITLQRWRWPAGGLSAEWRDANRGRMKGAETVLVGATALDTGQQSYYNNKPVGAGASAAIIHWDQKTDRDKN